MTDTSCGWVQPDDRSHDALLRHLPTGPAWLAWRTPGKIAFLLFRALSRAFEDAWVALCRLAVELDPRTTTELITEWETSVGLPDACLPTATTIEERRARVLWRLSKRRWTTLTDWHDLAAIFGVKIEITQGFYVMEPSVYPACYPMPYNLPGRPPKSYAYDYPATYPGHWVPHLGRFRIYVDIVDGCDFDGYPLPYASSYKSGNTACEAYMCVMERIKPANVVIIWNVHPRICSNRTRS